MHRLAPLGILTLGVILAGLFGARNGDAFTSYRSAEVQRQSVPSDAEPPAAPATLPGPRERLVGWWSVGGVGWGAGIGLIVLGAVMARRQQARDAVATAPSGRAMDMGEGLQTLLQEITSLQDRIAELAMDDDAPSARQAIDTLSLEVVAPLVDGRARFLARHGAAAFTEYFGPFSAGERQLARAWSALTDGHSVVARASLAQAHHSFAQALVAWDQAEAS